jgi:Asp-tRNA(Asn)/Glu-tRNA(Gln) amidotransferase A subunit family amidase
MDATISQLQAAMESGKVTSKDLVEMYLQRIDAYDRQGPQLRAMLAMNPFALEQACELDQERKQRGARGLLHGIPIVLKDNYNTKDMPTTGGAMALASFIPSDDAIAVKKLKAAGAVILGKTNLHELALYGLTRSSLGGQTVNPYDLTRTPGGSSGGTGAAVSANFAVAGTGTDTVNSIRSPASANNLVGIRPTKGLVNIDGIMPVSFTQDNAGPIARTVEDAAIMLEAVVESDERYSKSLDKRGLEGAKIGVLLNLFGTDQVHEEVNHATEIAMKEMKLLGAQVVEVTIPGLDTDKLIRDLDVQRYEMKPEINRYFSDWETPVATLEEFVAKRQHDASIETMLNMLQSMESPMEQPDYKVRLERIAELKKQILEVMDGQFLDVLLYPHQKRLVVKVGEETQADRNGILASLIGFPAITFQGGFSTPTETAPIGVPIGLELLGRPYTEAVLIRLAYAYEQRTGHRRMPLSTPDLH